MEEQETKTTTVKWEIDLKTGQVIGQVEGSGDANEISSGITKRIAALFNSNGTDWINQFRSMVDEQQFKAAYELLEAKKVFLSRRVQRQIFLDILKLDPNKLPSEKDLSFRLYVVALGYTSGHLEEIESGVSELMTSFAERLDKETKEKLLLIQAELLRKKKRFLLANQVLQRLVDSDSSDSTKAYAYKQLSWGINLSDDKVIYQQRAVDFFLITGDRREAVGLLMQLSDQLLSTSPDEALRKIEEALELLNAESSIEGELKASILQRKATLLFERNALEDCTTILDQVIELRERLLGNEEQKYASLMFARDLARIRGDANEVMRYQERADGLVNSIDSEEFRLQLRLQDAISAKRLGEPEIFDIIMHSDFDRLKIPFLVLRSLDQGVSFDDKLEFIDQAFEFAKSTRERNLYISIIQQALGEIYKSAGNIEKATESLLDAIHSSPWNATVLQACVNLLLHTKNWVKLEKVVGSQIALFGYAPNRVYLFGKSLLEQKKFIAAYKELIRCKGDLNFSIDADIEFCVSNLSSDEVKEIAESPKGKYFSLSTFEEEMLRVLRSISNSSRMYFWQHEKEKKHRWRSRPEEAAKQLLVQGLMAKYDGTDFELLEEVPAGPGRIDLYVILPNRLRVVIELKMCGHGYPSSYALSGTDQLVTYMESKNQKLGFLVVFDSRQRDFGKGYIKVQSISDKTIKTIAVDLRPKVPLLNERS